MMRRDVEKFLDISQSQSTLRCEDVHSARNFPLLMQSLGETLKPNFTASNLLRNDQLVQVQEWGRYLEKLLKRPLIIIAGIMDETKNDGFRSLTREKILHLHEAECTIKYVLAPHIYDRYDKGTIDKLIG